MTKITPLHLSSAWTQVYICWPCFKYRDHCIGFRTWPEASFTGSAGSSEQASPPGSKALSGGRGSRDSSPPYPFGNPAHPIPQDPLWHLTPGSRWTDSTELWELPEPGSFCPGSSSGLESQGPCESETLCLLLLGLSRNTSPSERHWAEGSQMAQDRGPRCSHYRAPLCLTCFLAMWS